MQNGTTAKPKSLSDLWIIAEQSSSFEVEMAYIYIQMQRELLVLVDWKHEWTDSEVKNNMKLLKQ